jgi:uroporphyrin-III C-methyltransferase / precorrin-2 dehydrogenase / sirohydrochlorin ferrochelatase
MSAAAGLFPLFLRLAGRRVVVVGGGAVAATRVRQLLDASAQVTVVAPSICDPIAASGARCLRRPFETSDLDGAWLAVAAATADVNRQVAREAEVRRVFVNAVDDPDAASAYTGGVLRRGDLLVAISTQGRAPALAGLVREALDLLLPSESSVWVERAAELRQGWKAARVPFAGRRPLLLEALNRLYAPREIRT